MPRREELPKLLGIVLSKSPKLLLKLSWRYLKVKKQAQRAEKAFRQQLEGGGVDSETGFANIRQTMDVTIYGRTAGGKAISVEFAVAFNFTCGS